MKPECARSRGEVERERGALQGQREGMQSDVEVLKGMVERQKEVLAEREGELVRRVQAARDEEYHKTATVHEENVCVFRFVLEDSLAELEQQRALQDAAGHTQKEECEERLHGAQLGEESAHKEFQNLRTKLQQQGSQLEEMEIQKTECQSETAEPGAGVAAGYVVPLRG